MNVRLAIIGSRSFNDWSLMCETLATIITDNHFNVTEIVSGGAKGADTLAERAAMVLNVPIKVIKPDWDTFGKRAGFIRNMDILNASDVVVAYWDMKSAGTKHSIDKAPEMGKKLFIVNTINQKTWRIIN